MDNSPDSDGQCNCKECARLRARLEQACEVLETWLESAHYNGRVVISEKALDDLLTALAAGE